MSTAMTSSQIDDRTVLPPSDLSDLLDLSLFLQQHTQPAALLGPDGDQVPLPLPVYEVLMQVVMSMRAGKAITVAPVDLRLTTQQAADLLGVSRPTLVKLLTEGEIPFDQPTGSRHRRLRLQDVLEYRDRRRAQRHSRLAEMTRQASEDGLYETSAEDYRQALAQARHGGV